jgi:hypothetical protein
MKREVGEFRHSWTRGSGVRGTFLRTWTCFKLMDSPICVAKLSCKSSYYFHFSIYIDTKSDLDNIKIGAVNSKFILMLFI